jgi:hypothetical protein
VKKAENQQHLPVDPDEREEIWLDSFWGRVVFFYRGELLSVEGGKLGAAVCLSVCRYSACFYGFQKDSQGVERSAKGSTYIMQCR